MKRQGLNFRSGIGMLIASCALLGSTASGQEATTLKDAYKDYFMVGVAVNRTIPTNTNVKCDNVDRTMEEVTKDIALVKQQFNQIVNENDLKWEIVHPRPGVYDFGPGDALVKFGQENNMYLVGHTLLWHSQTPGWVFQPDGQQEVPAEGQPARRGFGGNGPRASREVMIERMRDHIHTVVSHYKGKIKVWDVVNEALSDGGDQVLRSTQWTQTIGEDFIALAFKFAHEADPDAILRYNDYGLENPGKRAKLKKLVAQLREQNVPIHAIGTQTHINVSTTFETMDQTLADLASIGLPIHLTELDMNTSMRGQGNTNANIEGAAERAGGDLVSDADKRQAEAYANLFRALIKHKDSVEMVTFWGANDAVSWLGRARPLLFDGEDKPKYAFQAVIKVATEGK